MTTFRLETSSSIVSYAEAERAQELGFEFENWLRYGNDCGRWMAVTKKEVTIELHSFIKLFEFLKQWDAILSVDEKGPFIIINYWE